SAGSRFLQLDPPGQVEEGDFLRVEQVLSADASARNCVPVVNPEELRAIDHLVVSAVKGPIVKVRDPLPRDYAEGTRVQKVTRFELFEGKNWQEHVLFLGHNDYFAIKSEAEISLLVEHAPGASANLPAFKVVWEFFGVTETNKEEGWHEFKVDLDATRGFSRDGEVVLIKPAGEIKENEINGSTSRWIRARLDEPLPATPPTPLPKIESITLKVSSGGKDLPADQAFHNDTPLTTAVEFFPFGTEPRIFDRFSVASEEAFSKHGAEVTLDFDLDATDLLAAPAGIVNDGLLRVFAHAAAGRLVEFQIEPGKSEAVIKKHGTPPDTRIAAGSIPAVVNDLPEDRVGVFVKTEDGKIYLRLLFGAVESGWHWFNLNAPVGELEFNPSAVRVTTGVWHVFVVVNKQLFSKTYDPANNIQTDWTAHLDVQVPQIDSSPFAVDLGNTAAAFVTDVNGVTWGWDGLTWTIHTPFSLTEPDPAYVAAKNARPYVLRPANVSTFRIFLRSQANHLVVIDTGGTDESYGPPDNTSVDSNPFVAVSPSGVRAYVRGADDNLWSIADVPNSDWIPHLSPSDFKLASDPFALAYSNGQDSVSVFSTSDRNTLLEFRVSKDNSGGAEVGTLQAGPLDIVLLENDLDTEDYYIHITGGPGKSAAGDTVRKFKKPLTKDRFAVLDNPLEESPTTATTYNLLLEEGNGGLVQNATATTVELEQDTVPDVLVPAGDDGFKIFLLINDQIREVPALPNTGDDVTVASAWDTTPTAGDTYRILLLAPANENQTAGDASARRAVLDPNASNDDDEYNGRSLEITSGPGASSVALRINDYFKVNKSVLLEQDFLVPPPAGSDYTITAVEQVWFAYEDPDQAELRPELSWEYWNGKGWIHLPVKDSTENFLVPGKVIFTVPENIGKTEVAGQENYWIRARIVGGDYGRELFTVDPQTGRIKIERDPIRPPLVSRLAISYKLIELKPPQFCLTFNNLSFLDQTAANVTPDKHFKPYFPLPDAGKTVYFGFDRAFDGGPVRIYFAAKELVVDDRDRPKLDWQFAFDNDWKGILADDGTDAFTKPEFVSLIVPEGFQNRLQFGQALFWLRAALATGSWTASPLLAGVFVNTVEALQARTVSDERLGSSTGEKNQRFRFQQLPVIEGEEVRVREVLTDQEREELIAERGEDAVLAIRDQQGRVLETWIRWTEVLEFFNSEPASRHYRLDRATGEIEFGDGVRGRIPPAGGDNIRAVA
ncbi:MAG TPA: hypothetical protein VD861_07030, partial [Pyrinomonadaceae bacterium]|nr:hypothetical protein [Pyrinomonadaceae bacterium]